MPSHRSLAPTATGRAPSRLVRWATWEMILAVALVAVAWVGALYLPKLLHADRPGRWFLSSLILNAMFAGVPLCLLAFKHKQPVLGTLVPTDRAVTDFGWGLEIALIVGALNVLAMKRALPDLEAMAGASSGTPTAYPWYYLGAYKIASMRELVLFVFGWGIFPPIAEEIFFRGFLFAALRRRLRAGFAIPLSALAFSLIHYPHLEPMVATLVLGLVVATVYEYSGSLLSPIMAHMGLNLSFVLFMAMGGELADTVPKWILITGAAVFAVHFFVSSRYLFRKAR